MRRRPQLVDVRLIPWEMNCDLYGIACEYDDGETVREVWGTYGETMIAVSVRKKDVVSRVNLRRT
ncbi:MAG: hypothetical protein GEU95_12310 [Rhizobiales bacterium]|nr:hypothetical protein [Hyphomicrobiales bacterium]